MYQSSASQGFVERVLKVFIALDKLPRLARFSIWSNMAVYVLTATLVSVDVGFSEFQENLYDVFCMMFGGISFLASINCLLVLRRFVAGLVLFVLAAITAHVIPVYAI